MRKISVQQYVVKEFQFSEAIKVLRTNLMFCGANVRVVGLSSHKEAEGKSAIAFQLAVSLTQTGKRVLLLDADIRMSCLERRLHIKGEVKGLSHYLSGLANANELLVETDVEGLYIMFAGKRVPNAAELLGSEGLARLIPALKDSFDYVIVDTAPLGEVIDCAVVAPHLDGVLLVVDSSNNSCKSERAVQRQLEKSGGKVLGVVLNKIEYKQKKGYYGEHYSG